MLDDVKGQSPMSTLKHLIIIASSQVLSVNCQLNSLCDSKITSPNIQILKYCGLEEI